MIVDGVPAVSELEKNEVVAEEKNEIHDNDLKSVAAITEVEIVEPEVDGVTGADNNRETNLEDDSPSASGKQEHVEMVKVKIPSSEEAKCHVATNTTSPTDETSCLEEVATEKTSPMDENLSLNEAEQHSINMESNNNVNIMAMAEELPGNATIGNEETEPLISMAGEENSDEKPQQQEPECAIPHGPEKDTKLDVLVATPTSQRSIEEYDMVMGKDKMLIEENAKLREMMEKLMEAGKEQLSVISNLTGRVKKLERKLSKKKKLRTRRHAKAKP
ncbi:hypothetical protein Ddye_017645 [Dipteronia dyeriana]|uniref:Uncharacterized protein n=1 Tax=Dipteronia dyeriana TaxID=168575 RepID=A0AAD9U907_9ROSI|nr:hypothetical protein Ddye_017645 [Dipteronia dyeriana]